LITGNRLLAVLIVAATVAFAIGVSIERSQESGETSAEAGHVEGVGAEGDSAEGVSSEAQPHTDPSSETLLGVNPESIPLLIVAIVVSLALAGGVWLRPDLSILLIVVAVAMLSFAALDVREFVHQLDASRGGLAVLVALIALLHAAAAVLAIRVGRAPEPQTARPG
jgi:hypothetical protein